MTDDAYVSALTVRSSGTSATFEITVERNAHGWLGEPPLTDVPQEIRNALLRWLEVATP